MLRDCSMACCPASRSSQRQRHCIFPSCRLPHAWNEVRPSPNVRSKVIPQVALPSLVVARDERSSSSDSLSSDFLDAVIGACRYLLIPFSQTARLEHMLVLISFHILLPIFLVILAPGVNGRRPSLLIDCSLIFSLPPSLA